MKRLITLAILVLVTACVIKNEGTTTINVNVPVNLPKIEAATQSQDQPITLQSIQDTMYLQIDSVYHLEVPWSEGNPKYGDTFYYDMQVLHFEEHGSFAVPVDTQGRKHVPVEYVGKGLASYSKKYSHRGNTPTDKRINCWHFIEHLTGISKDSLMSPNMIYHGEIDTATLDYSVLAPGDIIVMVNVDTLGQLDYRHVNVVLSVDGGKVYCLNKQSSWALGIVDFEKLAVNLEYGGYFAHKPDLKAIRSQHNLLFNK